MTTASTSETSTNIYQTTRPNNPEVRHLQLVHFNMRGDNTKFDNADRSFRCSRSKARMAYTALGRSVGNDLCEWRLWRKIRGFPKWLYRRLSGWFMTSALRILPLASSGACISEDLQRGDSQQSRSLLQNTCYWCWNFTKVWIIQSRSLIPDLMSFYLRTDGKTDKAKISKIFLKLTIANAHKME
jgi:hypothetical protein